MSKFDSFNEGGVDGNRLPLDPPEKPDDDWGAGRLVFRRPEVGARRSAQLDVVRTRDELEALGQFVQEQLGIRPDLDYPIAE